MKRDSTETRALILESALKEISRKGFSDATIRQIAQNAKVTALTIFRHFSDKENLFASVIKTYSHVTVDEEAIKEKLTYYDIQMDLDTLSQEYFKIIFDHLDILRIFINEGYNNPMVQKDAWFISPVLQLHFKNCLKDMNLGNGNRDEIAEMFIGHVTRRVLEYNTHDSIWNYSLEIADDFRDNMKSQLDWIKKTLEKTH